MEWGIRKYGVVGETVADVDGWIDKCPGSLMMGCGGEIKEAQVSSLSVVEDAIIARSVSPV